MPPEAPDTHWLTAYLRERDVPCPACHAPLRNLAADVCPDCGNELALTLGTVDAPLRTWIPMAVASLASAGVGFFMIALVVQNGPPPYQDHAIFWLVWFFAASVPLAALVILARRRFLRLSRATQQRLSIGYVTIVFIAFLALIIKIKSDR